MLSATLTSPKWPTAWSTLWLLPTLAPDTAPAGMPSLSGSHSLTCLPGLLMLALSWCCLVLQRVCNAWWLWRRMFKVTSLFHVILMQHRGWLQNYSIKHPYSWSNTAVIIKYASSAMYRYILRCAWHFHTTWKKIINLLTQCWAFWHYYLCSYIWILLSITC